jgi:hypothetical protein
MSESRAPHCDLERGIETVGPSQIAPTMPSAYQAERTSRVKAISLRKETLSELPGASCHTKEKLALDLQLDIVRRQTGSPHVVFGVIICQPTVARCEV